MAQSLEGDCAFAFASRHPRINLVFEILKRCKASTLLGTMRPATAKRVESFAEERVQLICAACCQFKTCDEFHHFLRLLEAPTTGAFLAPDTDHHRRKGRMVGGQSTGRKWWKSWRANVNAHRKEAVGYYPKTDRMFLCVPYARKRCGFGGSRKFCKTKRMRLPS